MRPEVDRMVGNLAGVPELVPKNRLLVSHLRDIPCTRVDHLNQPFLR
jgi:hypothetical protein